jgi:hypothetical protein
MPGRDESGHQWTPDQTDDRQPTDSRYRHQGRHDTHGTGGREKGRGSHGERNTGAGISDRGMDREMNDEEERPDRDPRQSER